MPDLPYVRIGVGVAAVALVAALVYVKRKAIAGALGKLNPASSNNVVYGSVNALGAAVTGRNDGSFTVGSAIYDAVDSVAGWFGKGDIKADAPAAVKPVPGYDFPQVWEIPGQFYP